MAAVGSSCMLATRATGAHSGAPEHVRLSTTAVAKMRINLVRMRRCRYLPQVVAQLSATGGRCGAPAISQAEFWAILKLQVAKGAFDDARTLLATHWLASSAPAATLTPEDIGLQILLGQVRSSRRRLLMLMSFVRQCRLRVSGLGGCVCVHRLRAAW
jgi:hypothetical protein